ALSAARSPRSTAQDQRPEKLLDPVRIVDDLLQGQGGGALEADVPFQAAGDYPGAAPPRRHCVARHRFLPTREEDIAGLGQSSTQNHHLGVEDMDQAGDATAEIIAGRLNGVKGFGVPAAGELEKILETKVRFDFSPAPGLIERDHAPVRHVRLEASSTAADARHSVGLNFRVPE